MLNDPKNDVLFDDEDDEFLFADEDEGETTTEVEKDWRDYWKVLIVDDEEQIHNVTQFALKNFVFERKSLIFVSAYSGEEAKKLILDHPDTAVIILDVVMETEDAGLRFVKWLRDECGNRSSRIILRTGQPGQAPEETIIIEYDINDYKTKTELTVHKLFISMVTALRSYRDLNLIEFSRSELKKLVQAYERFVPHEFLSLLDKETITDVKLGDQIQQSMTVLFADIRGFTELSEKMTPQENFNFLNSYLSIMEPVIRAYNGLIDKYIGDAIMALFPTNADDALQASIAMLKMLIQYNEGRQRAGYDSIQIGIGLNTGSLMLGTVGGERRMDGTVVSDAVNIAAHIESLTKVYGVSLLIGSSTYSQLQDQTKYYIRVVDRVQIKGKSKPVTVFEVFDGCPSDIIDLKLKTYDDFEQGFLLYRHRDFAEAEKHFKRVLEINKDDKAALIYLTRCQRLQKYDEVGLRNWQEGAENMVNKIF